MDAFDQIIGLVLENEIGHDPKNPDGYVNNPHDPGGETKFGISKRYHPDVDVKNLTLDGAKAIYRNEYYLANHLDQLNDVRVQYYMLDMIVNMGSGKHLIQTALFVTSDGKIGPETIAAANGRDVHGLLDALLELRVKQYVHDIVVNPDELYALPDWIRRAFMRFNVLAAPSPANP